jgi:hypothetical protein
MLAGRGAGVTCRGERSAVSRRIPPRAGLLRGQDAAYVGGSWPLYRSRIAYRSLSSAGMLQLASSRSSLARAARVAGVAVMRPDPSPQ